MRRIRPHTALVMLLRHPQCTKRIYQLANFRQYSQREDEKTGKRLDHSFSNMRASNVNEEGRLLQQWLRLTRSMKLWKFSGSLTW